MLILSAHPVSKQVTKMLNLQMIKRQLLNALYPYFNRISPGNNDQRSPSISSASHAFHDGFKALISSHSSRCAIWSINMNMLVSNLINHFSPYCGDGLILHIKEHLRYLLNTRRDSIMINPEYGLADSESLWHQLPKHENQFINSLENLIATYEPRLSQIVISKLPNDDSQTMLKLKMKAMLCHQKEVVLVITFTKDAKVYLK